MSYRKIPVYCKSQELDFWRRFLLWQSEGMLYFEKFQSIYTCANEGGICVIDQNKNAPVRYWDKGSIWYTYKIVNSSVDCSDSVFVNPAPK